VKAKNPGKREGSVFTHSSKGEEQGRGEAASLEDDIYLETEEGKGNECLAAFAGFMHLEGEASLSKTRNGRRKRER